jgi:hypothetical protein
LRQRTMLAGVLIMAGVATRVAHGAGKNMHACSLLTSAEIAAAVGGTVGEPHENDIVISEGPSKGETMGMCAWAAGSQGSVSVAVIRAPQGRTARSGTGAVRAGVSKPQSPRMERGKERLQQWHVRAHDAPPSGKGLPISTSCLAESKGMGISVGHNGSSRVPMDKVKTLLDKRSGGCPKVNASRCHRNHGDEPLGAIGARLQRPVLRRRRALRIQHGVQALLIDVAGVV